MTVFDKGLITVLAVDALCALVSVPLVFRKVPRNIVYGYRTRATLADDGIWYEANAFFGRWFLLFSALSAGLMFALYRSESLSPQAFMKTSIAALVAPVLLAAVVTSRFVRTLGAAGR